MAEASMCDVCGKFNVATTITYTLSASGRGWEQQRFPFDACSQLCVIVGLLRRDYTVAVAGIESNARYNRQLLLDVAEKVKVDLADERIEQIKNTLRQMRDDEERPTLDKVAALLGMQRARGEDDDVVASDLDGAGSPPDQLPDVRGGGKRKGGVRGVQKGDPEKQDQVD